LGDCQQYARNAGFNHESKTECDRSAQDRAWLREQLLAGKISLLRDRITPTHFDELRARVRRTMEANYPGAKSHATTTS
jgi:hypothetical protein